MDTLTFNAFKDLCESNPEKKHVPEMLELLSNSDHQFTPGIVGPYGDLVSLYKLRLDIARSDSKSGPEYLADFEQTIASMTKIKSTTMGVAWLKSTSTSFLTFYAPTTNKIIGVLKANA